VRLVSPSPIRREVYAQANRAIKALGFRGVAGQPVFLKEIADGIEGVLTLPASRAEGGRLRVSLDVGFIVTEAERVIDEWCDQPPGLRYTTLGNVGYLKPEHRWREVQFSEGQAVDEGVRQLVDWAVTDAVPFLAAHASLRGVAEVLESGMFPGGDRFADERLPVLYALDGDAERAAAALSRIEARAADPNSFMTFRYVSYLEGFRKSFPSAQ
jgi:hypothetical protein